MPPSHLLLDRAGGRGSSDGGNDNSSKNIGVDIVVPVVASVVGFAILLAAFFIGRQWRKRGEPMYGDRVIGKLSEG